MMITLVLVGIALLVMFVIGFFSMQRASKQAQNLQKRFPTLAKRQKPIVMLIVDSLMTKPLIQAMQAGRAPALKFLSDQGNLFPKVVSSFPTMSVTIDSTLLTGTSPNQHQIFGLNYYDPKQKRIVNFGTGAIESFRVGLKQVLTDSLIHLNHRYLHANTKTIHEAFDGPTASINAFVYRGNHSHTLHIPWLMRQFVGFPPQLSIKGPALFSFGKLHKLNPHTRHDPIWHRYGGNDRFTTDELTFLIRKQLLPPFTIAYFPSNDDVVHQKGSSVLKGIERFDKSLQSILNSYASWKEALEQTIFIVLGDSGQTDTIANQQQAFVDLKQLLAPYQITPVQSQRPQAGDQLVCCVNERMAYLYLLDEQLSFTEVVNRLKQEKRIDLIAWKENGHFHVVSGEQKGGLRFSAGGEFVDEYQQTWSLEGNLAILDLSVNDHTISYGIYPDALSRLQGVSETYERVIILTAAPGYELIFGPSPKHRGASHGSLHYLDSYVPMIVAGTDSTPRYSRIIDIKAWLLDLLQT